MKPQDSIFTDEFTDKIRDAMRKFSLWYKDHFNFIPVHFLFISIFIVIISILYPFAMYGMIRYAEYWANIHPDVPIDGTIIYLLWSVVEKFISVYLWGYIIIFVALPLMAWAADSPKKTTAKITPTPKKKSPAKSQCPYCKSTNTVKKGKTRAGTQRYLCKKCKRNFGFIKEEKLV